MPYIVVRNDEYVLSRTRPQGLLEWRPVAKAEDEGYYYTIIFDTCAGATKCASMHGGSPYQFAAWQRRRAKAAEVA